MRRIRPGIVIAGCLLAGLATVTAVLWHQGDFWRESAANYLRERLAADFGAQFQTSDLRGRWFPPGLSLGHVTIDRSGEPWVLTAEDVRISFNPYAVLFGRERLGRVVIEHPRLFVRTGNNGGTILNEPPLTSPSTSTPTPSETPPGIQTSSPATTPSAPGGTGPGIAQRLRSFLSPPFPLRVLEIADGRIDIIDRNGGRTVAAGIDLSVLVAKGNARALLKNAHFTIERAGNTVDLGRMNADVALDEGLATVRELVLTGGPVAGTLQGTMDYEGVLALKGLLSARLEMVAALLGRTAAAGGTASFEGEISGSWRDPAGAGTLAVRDLVLGGRHWPPARGRVGWGGGRLFWSQLNVAVGAGAVISSGEAGFSGGALRYRVDAEARDVDPALVPAVAGEVADRVRGLAGKLHWEGAGVGATAAGSGTLEARCTLAAWPGEEVTLDAEAGLESGVLAVHHLRGATRSLEVAGAGLWSPGGGFSGQISGTVADLRRLLPAEPLLAGSGAFAGDLVVDAHGPQFTGSVHLANVSVGTIRGVKGDAKLDAAAGSVRLVEGAVAWPGGSGTVNGTIEIPSGRLDLVGVFPKLSLPEAARLFGVDSRDTAGTLGARLRVRGTTGAPEVEGEISGNALRYGALTVDAASLSLTYAARLLGINQLRLRRGATQLTFHGQLREEQTIEGQFESPSFDLADFPALASLELAGALRGRVEGPLRDPHVAGTVSATRLRYAGFDLKGGEFAVDYRGGTAAIEGWIAVRENRLRAVLEPARDWRFESDLELRQFAPEMVHSGLGVFPPAMAKALGKAAFLASGRLQARGRLRDPGSVRADLRLETLWLQAAGKSLQNLSPVRISWRDGGLVVEEFRIAGEQYHLDVRGGGSLAAGWNLQADGAVNLSAFREYWPEIEDLDGAGDLRLTLSGPWSAPLPEGSLDVHEAYVRARSLPEPLEHLAGRLELRGGTLTATNLSGSIGGGAFRGGGSYQFAQDHLDAHVEGRLDLALFRSRLPVARELRGPIEVRLHMIGPIAAATFTGEVEVLDAEMFFRPFPAKITHLKGNVLVGAERLEVRELAGQTGGGTVRLTGTMDWSRSPVRVDAELEGRGVLISLAGALKAQSDLRLDLKGDFQALKLAGEVRILKARYLREFSERPPTLDPALGQSGDPARGMPDFSRLALDVKVVAADNVWIENRMAKIETAVALVIGGRLGAPVVSGEITGIQGEAYYISRQFRLESGSLRFVPPATVPLLDLQASTSVGETQVLFLMDGPLDNLSYHLTSLPGMSQQDLVALLTIGETRSGLALRGERASTAGAAVFTSEPLVNALGDEARRAIGLETLQLAPVVGADNQLSARVTLGTHLSDRLFVSYSQNLGATEDQQVTAQYSLLDYLSIWGQELRQGIFSLDLVFRYALK